MPPPPPNKRHVMTATKTGMGTRITARGGDGRTRSATWGDHPTPYNNTGRSSSNRARSPSSTSSTSPSTSPSTSSSSSSTGSSSTSAAAYNRRKLIAIRSSSAPVAPGGRGGGSGGWIGRRGRGPGPGRDGRPRDDDDIVSIVVPSSRRPYRPPPIPIARAARSRRRAKSMPSRLTGSGNDDDDALGGGGLGGGWNFHTNDVERSRDRRRGGDRRSAFPPPDNDVRKSRGLPTPYGERIATTTAGKGDDDPLVRYPPMRRYGSSSNDEDGGRRGGGIRSTCDHNRGAKDYRDGTPRDRRRRSSSNNEKGGMRRIRSTSDHHRGTKDDRERISRDNLDSRGRRRSLRNDEKGEMSRIRSTSDHRRGTKDDRERTSRDNLDSRGRRRSLSNIERGGTRRIRSTSDHHRGTKDDRERTSTDNLDSRGRRRSLSNIERGGMRRVRSTSDHRRGAKDDMDGTWRDGRRRSSSNNEKVGRRGVSSTINHHRVAWDDSDRTSRDNLADDGRNPTPTRRDGGGGRLTRHHKKNEKTDQLDRSYRRDPSKEKTHDPSSHTRATNHVWTDEVDFRRHRRQRLQRLREGQHAEDDGSRQLTDGGLGWSHKDDLMMRYDVDYGRSNSMPMSPPPPPPSAGLSRYPVIACDLTKSMTGNSIVSPIASLDSSWIHLQAKSNRLRREMKLRQVSKERLYKDWRVRRSKSCEPKSSRNHVANESTIVSYEKSKSEKHYILDILGVPVLDCSDSSESRQQISWGTATTFHKRASDPVATPVASIVQSLSTSDAMTLSQFEGYGTISHPPTGSIERSMLDYDGIASTQDDSIGCVGDKASQLSNPPPHNKSGGYGFDFANDGSFGSLHIDAPSIFRTKQRERLRQNSSGADTWQRSAPDSLISLSETVAGVISCEITTPNPLMDDYPKTRIKRSKNPVNPAAVTNYDTGSASTTENTTSLSDPSHENKSGGHCKDNENVSDGSLFNVASPTLGMKSSKISPTCTVPPLHAAILSKKPSVLPLHRARSWGKKPHDNRRSVRSSAHKESKEGSMNKEKKKVSVIDSLASLPAASKPKLGYEIDVNSNNSFNQISEITIPNMLHSEPMLVQALKKYQQLTKKMKYPPDMSRLIEKSQKVAVPRPPPPFLQGCIVGTVDQRQQSEVPMPGHSHPPKLDSKDVERQQKSEVPWMPPLPPPRLPGPRLSPRSTHQQTINKMSFCREMNASVNAMLANTNSHQPHLQHQSHALPSMNNQGKHSNQANENLTLIPLKSPTVSPPSPQVMTPSTEKIMKKTKQPSSEGRRENTRNQVSQRTGRVENLHFIDDNGDAGMYTGETNEYGYPHGKGKMKYENGVFFEGKWINGVRDGGNAQRERLMTGFSSWNGAKKDHAHGMIWVDPLGNSGRYTGNLNKEGLPHGIGLMSYSSGLNVEGMWVNGKLINDDCQGNPSPSLPGMVGG